MKKTAENIVDGILKAIEDKEPKTITEIAKQIKSNQTTVKDYIEMMMKIQDSPKIVIEKIKNLTLIKLEKTTDKKE